MIACCPGTIIPGLSVRPIDSFIVVSDESHHDGTIAKPDDGAEHAEHATQSLVYREYRRGLIPQWIEG